MIPFGFSAKMINSFLIGVLLVFGGWMIPVEAFSQSGALPGTAADQADSAVDEAPGGPADSADDEPEGDEFYDEEYDDAYGDDWLEEEDTEPVADPLAPWNMLMYRFNDKLYLWVLKPVAQGYMVITPDWFRVGIRNFFSHLETPVQFANCLLQGKGTEAEVAIARFMVNTTIGVFGFGDPASDFDKLQPPDEDLGQTFGVWGIGTGWYLILPVLGPSTIRDTAGMAGDMFLQPTYYLDAVGLTTGLSVLNTVNRTSFRIGDYETIKSASLDPYVAIRDGYLQFRKSKVER